MSIADALAPYEAAYRNRLIAHTWGHLFPKSSLEPVRGMLRVAQTAYSGTVVLDLEIEIPDSPWWGQALTDFLDRFDLSMGEVAELIIDVRVVTDIHEIPYMSEIELAEAEDGWDDWLIEYAKIKYSERIAIEVVEEGVILAGLT